MSGTLRVVVEIGPKSKRVVAGATDWPGLDRWGKTEDEAVEKLASYMPRYSGVAVGAGLANEFARSRTLDVIERYPGNTSTDWWGIAQVPSQTERAVLPAAELDRRLEVLRAAWSYFDDVASRVSAELRPGARGGGWTRDEIVRHVHANEAHQFTRKVGVRTPRDVVLTPDGRAVHRFDTLDAIRDYNAAGRIAGRSWSIQFLIRRIGQHVMDHAWEMEDRDLTE
jgi:hypothetical protein